MIKKYMKPMLFLLIFIFSLSMVPVGNVSAATGILTVYNEMGITGADTVYGNVDNKFNTYDTIYVGSEQVLVISDGKQAVKPDKVKWTVTKGADKVELSDGAIIKGVKKGNVTLSYEYGSIKGTLKLKVAKTSRVAKSTHSVNGTTLKVPKNFVLADVTDNMYSFYNTKTNTFVNYLVEDLSFEAKARFENNPALEESTFLNAVEDSDLEMKADLIERYKGFGYKAKVTYSSKKIKNGIYETKFKIKLTNVSNPTYQTIRYVLTKDKTVTVIVSSNDKKYNSKIMTSIFDNSSFD